MPRVTGLFGPPSVVVKVPSAATGASAVVASQPVAYTNPSLPQPHNELHSLGGQSEITAPQQHHRRASNQANCEAV